MTDATIQATLTRLRRDEGLRLKPYQDTVGVWTIGYGHNLSAKPITKQAAEWILQDDLHDAIEAAETYPWFEGLGAARQVVVVSLIFNLGHAGFAEFTRTIRAIKGGDYDTAAKELLDSKWATQVGDRAFRLAMMLRTGILPPP